MTRTSKPRFFPLLSTIAVMATIFVSSCDWIPYVQKSYESRIGKKLVAARNEAIFEYETGMKLKVKIDDSRRNAISRKLYYLGVADSTVEFLWQKYDHSTFSSTTDRTLEKSPIRFDIREFPFTVNVRGFSVLIHEADTSHITYTLLSAEPTDLPDTSTVQKSLQ